jgi:tRNA threonylcarbamoyladenosine biosynthesis protein TsaB
LRERTLLAFDTSAAHCAAVVLSGETVMGLRAETMDRGQAERLFPMLEDLLAECGVAWTDLEVIGIGTGPGNFTGIRIAVAAARGLSLSLGIPAIGVSGLEVLAFGYEGAVRAALPAPREALYLQDFTDGTAMTVPRIAGPDDSDLWPSHGSRAIGDWTDLPGMPREMRIERPDLPARIEALAQIALRRADTPQPRPAPLYLRPADAAPSRDGVPLLLP